MSAPYGLHADSQKVAEYICAESATGSANDSYTETVTIQEAVDLTADEVAMAVDELLEMEFLSEHRVMRAGGSRQVRGTLGLFLAFDDAVKGWSGEEDAVRVAEEFVKSGHARCEDIAKALGWDARRINPPCGHLVEDEIVLASRGRPSYPFAYTELRATDRTERFVRDNT